MPVATCFVKEAARVFSSRRAYVAITIKLSCLFGSIRAHSRRLRTSILVRSMEGRPLCLHRMGQNDGAILAIYYSCKLPPCKAPRFGLMNVLGRFPAIYSTSPGGFPLPIRPRILTAIFAEGFLLRRSEKSRIAVKICEHKSCSVKR